MGTLPEHIEVRCKVKGAPFKGAWIILVIKTSYKNPFNLLFGPTNSLGEIAITRAQVLAEAEKNRRMFLMDYGHPEEDWTGHIEIEPMNVEDVQKALQAHELFKGAFKYPEDFQQKLLDYLEGLKQVIGERLDLEAWVKGGQAKLSVRGKVVKDDRKISA